MMENKIIWQDRKHFMWFPISFTKYEIKSPISRDWPI